MLQSSISKQNISELNLKFYNWFSKGTSNIGGCDVYESEEEKQIMEEEDGMEEGVEEEDKEAGFEVKEEEKAEDWEEEE